MRRFFRWLLGPDPPPAAAADAATRYARKVRAQTETVCAETEALIRGSKRAERRHRLLVRTLPAHMRARYLRAERI